MIRLRATAGRLTTSVVVVAIVVAWFALFRPTTLGGPAAYVVVAGDSMLPGLRSGDLVVAQHRPDYDVGDVVVYRVPAGEPGAGASVIHRVVGGSLQDGLVTRGDNTDAADIWRPGPADVLGSAWFSVPGVGRIIAFVRSPLGLGAIAGLGAFVLILSWQPTKDGQSPRSDSNPRSPRPRFRPR
jgi:signal peptidase I